MSKNTQLHFTKMHGLGNDFIVLNALSHSFEIKKIPLIQLADRHRGIGFDQLLTIDAGQKAEFFCRIFNAYGSEAEQCGNGLRCVARFIHEEKLHTATTFQLETKAGIYPVSIRDYDHIAITMGAPHIQENLIDLQLPMIAPVSILSLGNPHAVLKVASIDAILADELAPKISTHALFPQGVNVGFMQVMGPHHVRLRTFERGVGETHACGSNACAAMVAGTINGWLQPPVEVEFRYGSLWLDWAGKGTPITMTGPASRVFDGTCVPFI